MGTAITKFSISTRNAPYDRRNPFEWARNICTEFITGLSGAISGRGWEISETYYTPDAIDMRDRSQTYFCDFRLRKTRGSDNDVGVSLMYRIQMRTSGAVLGVINETTMPAAVLERPRPVDFRGLRINNSGRTNFLGFSTIRASPDDRPPNVRILRADLVNTVQYHFKVLVADDTVCVWTAHGVPANRPPDREGTYRVYANVLSCILMRHTSVISRPAFVCNGCIDNHRAQVRIFRPNITATQRTSPVQLCRMLLASAQTTVFNLISRDCILLSNYKSFIIEDFELIFETPYHIFVENKFLHERQIAAYGFLNSVQFTNRHLTAFVDIW